MKNKQKSFSALILLGVASVFMGCTAVNTSTMAVDDVFGGPPKEMNNTNHWAVVEMDEGPYEAAIIGRQNFMRKAGMRDGEPNSQYRVVLIRMANYDRPAIPLYSAVLVPDHVPLLQRNDIVEVRLTKIREPLLGFSGTQDVPVVLQVSCPRRPDYASDEQFARFKECRRKSPRIPEMPRYELVISKSTYAKHWKDLGITQTPRYGLDHKELPGLTPIPSRAPMVRALYSDLMQPKGAPHQINQHDELMQ